MELDGTVSATDPLPTVPAFRLDEVRVRKLTTEIGKKAADTAAEKSPIDPLQVNIDAIENLNDLRSTLAAIALLPKHSAAL